MANVAGQTTAFNSLNYLGQLFRTGTKGQTNLMSLLSSRTPVAIADLDYALNSNYTLEDSSQKSITEQASTTAPAALTYVREQELQANQIFQYTIDVTDIKIRARARRSGLNQANEQAALDELQFQIDANLAQMRQDMEWHFLNGTYQKATATNVASQMRGILNDANITAINAGGAVLDRAIMDNLFASMATAGARFQDAIILVPAAQKTKLGSIYTYEPTSREVGGSNIQRIYHNFGSCDILYVPNSLVSTTIAVVDLAFLTPTFLPNTDGTEVSLEMLARTGMAQKHQLVAVSSLDYAHGSLHAKITNLAV